MAPARVPSLVPARQGQPVQVRWPEPESPAPGHRVRAEPQLPEAERSAPAGRPVGAQLRLNVSAYQACRGPDDPLPAGVPPDRDGRSPAEAVPPDPDARSQTEAVVQARPDGHPQAAEARGDGVEVRDLSTAAAEPADCLAHCPGSRRIPVCS
jgi:hypothetical protein